MNAVVKTSPADQTRRDTEQVHFRIDDLCRDLVTVKRLLTPEHLVGAVRGVIAEYVSNLPRDGNLTLIARIDNLIAKQDDLIAKQTELIAVLRSPVTRTCTVDLPSGPVTMNVREEHDAPWGKR
jgi:hypothetical protein